MEKASCAKQWCQLSGLETRARPRRVLRSPSRRAEDLPVREAEPSPGSPACRDQEGLGKRTGTRMCGESPGLQRQQDQQGRAEPADQRPHQELLARYPTHRRPRSPRTVKETQIKAQRPPLEWLYCQHLTMPRAGMGIGKPEPLPRLVGVRLVQPPGRTPWKIQNTATSTSHKIPALLALSIYPRK